MSRGVWSERPLPLQGGVLRSCKECALWMKDGLWLWTGSISEKQGDYTVWGTSVYHSKNRNKLILTVILLLGRSDIPTSTKWFSVSELWIILSWNILLKVPWWVMELPQYNINSPDTEVLYTGSSTKKSNSATLLFMLQSKVCCMFFKLTKIFTESVENFISVQGQGPP